MKKKSFKIDFYREVIDGRFYWYANVPKHTKEENQMVSGADMFLEALLKYQMDTPVRLPETNCLSIWGQFGRVKDDSCNCMFHLHRVSHTPWGATYRVFPGEKLKAWFKPGTEMWERTFVFAPRVWLCNVMHTVLGRHPRELYIQGCGLTLEKYLEPPIIRTIEE